MQIILQYNEYELCYNPYRKQTYWRIQRPANNGAVYTYQIPAPK